MKNSSNEKRNISEWKGIMQIFLETCISEILSDRIPGKMHKIKSKDNQNSKSNTLNTHDNIFSPLSFFASESDFLDETIKSKVSNLFEEDEYKDLRRKSPNDATLANSISLKFYACKRGIKFVVEEWNFYLNLNDQSKSKRNFRLLFTYKKLSVLIRTVLSLIKLLPFNSIKNLKIFEIQLEVTNETKNDLDPGEKYHTMNFQNYSDAIGSLKLEVKYLEKTSIFKLEEMKKQDFYSKLENYSSYVSTNSVGSRLLTTYLNDYVSVEIVKDEKRSLSPKYSETTNASSSVSNMNNINNINNINKETSNEIGIKSFLDFVKQENNLKTKYQEMLVNIKIQKDLIDFNSASVDEKCKEDARSNTSFSDYGDLKLKVSSDLNSLNEASFSEYELHIDGEDIDLASSVEIPIIDNTNLFSVSSFLNSYQNVKKNLENSVYRLNIVNLMKCKNLFL